MNCIVIASIDMYETRMTDELYIPQNECEKDRTASTFIRHVLTFLNFVELGPLNEAKSSLQDFRTISV